MENPIAHQKLSTVKPGTMALTPNTSNPMITNVNNPNVNRFIGKVMSNNNGKINEFTIPKTTATTSAVKNPST